MDAPSPTPEWSRELADLRRRAYGPDADIQRDPDALRRLDELEAQERAPAVSPAARAPEPPAIAAEERPAVGVPPPAGAPAPPPRRRWWHRVPVWTVAVASLVAGLVIGLSAVGLSRPSGAADPGPDLTLTLVAGAKTRAPGFAQNLAYWGVDPSSVVAFEPLDSIEVWTGRGTDGSQCILLSPGGHVFTATCAARGLDPVFDYIVHTNNPVAFDGATLPEGSVIRFIAHDEGVDVWVRKSGATLSDLTS